MDVKQKSLTITVTTAFAAMTCAALFQHYLNKRRTFPIDRFWAQQSMNRLVMQCEIDLAKDPNCTPRANGDLLNCYTTAKKYKCNVARLEGILTCVLSRDLKNCVEMASMPKYRDGRLLHALLSLISTHRVKELIQPSDLLTKAYSLQRASQKHVFTGIASILKEMSRTERVMTVAGLVAPMVLNVAISSNAQKEYGSLHHYLASATTVSSVRRQLLEFFAGRCVISLRNGFQVAAMRSLGDRTLGALTSLVYTHVATADQEYVDALFGNITPSEIGMSINTSMTALQSSQRLVTEIGDAIKVSLFMYSMYGPLSIVYNVVGYLNSKLIDMVYGLFAYTEDRASILLTYDEDIGAGSSEWLSPIPHRSSAVMFVFANSAAEGQKCVGLSVLALMVTTLPKQWMTPNELDVLTNNALQPYGNAIEKEGLCWIWKSQMTTEKHVSAIVERSDEGRVCHLNEDLSTLLSPSVFALLRPLGCEVSEVDWCLRVEECKQESSGKDWRIFLDYSLAIGESPVVQTLRTLIPSMIAAAMTKRRAVKMNANNADDYDDVEVENISGHSNVVSSAAGGVTEFLTAPEGTQEILLLTSIMSTTAVIDRHDDSGIRNVRLKGKVEFRNVWYAYPTNKTSQVLEDVSFVVLPGQSLGIVGATGCGKTTILSLLMRLYVPDAGSILIDDRCIEEYNVGWLRSQFGYVPQTGVLFRGTIEANIMYDCPIASHHEVVETARLADAHDFIMKKAKGYATDTDNLKLSGGQKQRITIARSLLTHNQKVVYLFDEYTSALDAVSEETVRSNVEGVLNNKTRIVVAHRLRTVQDTTCILVLEKGRVVECGAHDELIKRSGGVYQRMVHLQSMPENDDDQEWDDDDEGDVEENSEDEDEPMEGEDDDEDSDAAIIQAIMKKYAEVDDMAEEGMDRHHSSQSHSDPLLEQVDWLTQFASTSSLCKGKKKLNSLVKELIGAIEDSA